MINFLFSEKIIIPMDETQSDHLKAYGIAFWSLENKHEVDWLLNYKGGSFVLKSNQGIENECLIRGVSYYKITSSEINNIYQII